MDFTLNKYAELCAALSSLPYQIMTMADFFERRDVVREGQLVMLRHDVDRKPLSALRMARLEAEFGIRSTYYFRAKSHTYQEEIIKTIAGLGHEIGYHYESLSDTGGDMNRALEDFSGNLDRFRSLVSVKTICMHGRPLSKWDNRLLWEKWDFQDFGLLGEPYISIDFQEVYYLSDTGRSWDKDAPNVRDRVDNIPGPRISTTDEVIKLLGSGRFSRFLLLAHPERWSHSPGDFIVQYCRDTMANFLKGLIR